MNPIHGLPNELVFELCREIQAVQMPDTILLTSINIHAYLAERYRKKLVYRDAIAVIKARLNGANANENKVTINVGRTCHPADGEQLQCANDFKLQTSQLRIRVNETQTPSWHNLCSISNDAFESAHLQYFVRLIAPLITPITLDLLTHFYCNDTTLPCFLNSLGKRIDWILIYAEHFILEPISAALNECCSNLTIYLHADLGDDQRLLFRRKFIQWLNNDGRSKQCNLVGLESQELTLLSNEIKTDFYRATSRRALYIRVYIDTPPNAVPAVDFNVHNSIGEQLELGHKIEVNSLEYCYTLIRRPIAGLENNQEEEEELANDNIRKRTVIVFV